MANTYTCDYCRAAIDTSSDDSLIVTVHRRVDDDEWGDEFFCSGGNDVFRFCSQAHLASHMERTPLPAAHDDDDEEDLGVVGCLVLLSLALVAIALMIGAGYGLYQFMQEVL